MARYSLTIARFPGNHSEHDDSSGYLMKLFHKELRESKDLDYDGIKVWKKSDTPIDMVRNACAWDVTYLHESDYLLMIDSDMSPDLPVLGHQPFWKTAWEWLTSHRDRPGMVAAPYCGPPPFENVYIFQWNRRESDAPTSGYSWCLDQISREEAVRFGGVSEVAALPTGLMLIDTRVFRAMDELDKVGDARLIPWFSYEWSDRYRRKKDTTEDVYFTRNASLAGFPCWCAWQSWAGHNKLKCVGKPSPMTIDDVRGIFSDARTTPAENEKVCQVGENRWEWLQRKMADNEKRRSLPEGGVGMTVKEKEGRP